MPTNEVTYYVAISSDALLPDALSATFTRDVANPLIRLEPVDSINRVVDDRIGFTGSGITTAGSSGAVFPASSAADLNAYADPYQFGDVALFVNSRSGTSGNSLATVNPLTGTRMTTGSLSVPDNDATGYANIAMRNDGRLYSMTLGSGVDNSGNYVQFNTADGTIVENTDDMIKLYKKNNDDSIQQVQTGIQFDAYTFQYDDPNDPTSRRLFAIGHRSDDSGSDMGRVNLLVELNPDTGEILTTYEDPPLDDNGPRYLTNTNVTPLYLGGTSSNPYQAVGMTAIGSTKYYLTSNGLLWKDGAPPTSPGHIVSQGGAAFTGLTVGPQNVEGGRYSQMLFAIDTNGRLYAFDDHGAPQGIFLNGASQVSTGITNPTGIAFSTLDFNLWHATTARAGDLGHGISPAFDGNAARLTNAQQLAGGESFYFGLNSDTPSINGNSVTAPYATNRADIFNTYALPGGAYGSMTTETFSLQGYSSLDYPTLYFNYYLDTINSAPQDAFRVYASTDNVTWQMLATDNGSETPSTLTLNGSGNQRVQQLFSNSSAVGDPDNTILWRQARVDLGDFAGESNIRLKFAFSTAGSLGSGNTDYGTGQTLRAVPASELSDGDTFSVSGQDFTFKFSGTASGGTIVLGQSDSAELVANKIAAAFDRVFGTNATAGPNDVHTVGKVVGHTTSDGTQTYENYEVRIFGHNITNSGPLEAFTGQLPGDSNSVFTSRARDRSFTSFEGVYVDDIVVGFASRGEIVTNALPGDTTYGSNPGTSSSQIQIGTYQLEIRPATAYGTTGEDGGPLRLTASYDINDRFAQAISVVARPGSMVDTTAGVTDSDKFSIDDGTQVLTFEFDSDGNYAGTSTTGHVQVPFQPSFSANEIAIAISNAINGAVLNRGFKVRATLSSDLEESKGSRVDLFNALKVTNTTDCLADVIQRDFVGDVRPTATAARVSAPGQTIIQATTISNARQVGIQVVPKIHQIIDPLIAFTVLGNFPIGTPGNTGSISTLPIPNGKGWVPGVTIKNNLIVHTGRTAIEVGGDPNASYAYEQQNNKDANFYRDVELFLPFVRVINNTIYDARIGIAAVNAASPTILNNIIANSGVAVGPAIRIPGAAIYVDDSSGAPKAVPDGITIKFGESVLGENLYQNNTTNVIGSSDTHEIILQPGDPLFVDAAHDNFYLSPQSQAIDSSINSLQDRLEVSNVGSALGIPPLPIQAPDTDLLGQVRIDDLNVAPPGGIGSNPYKDRGALERADFSGPTAALVTPLDNDAAGLDRNSLANQVVLVNQVLTEFSIQLLDGIGVGIDDSSVDVSKFIVQRTVDGVTTTLTPNVDYVLAYDSNNKIARLIPSQGLWINGLYEIQLNNSTDPIQDLAQNALQPNYNPSGGAAQTRFVIQLTDAIQSDWQNPSNRFDVSGDGLVTTRDLLILIDNLIRDGSHSLPLVADVPPYLDVNGDGRLSPNDLLSVINELNSIAAAPAAPAAAPLVAPLASAGTEPLSDDASDAVAASLSLNPSAGPQAAPGGSLAAEQVTTDNVPATSSRSVAAAWTALAQQQAATSKTTTTVDYHLWDSELDNILNDLTGDLLDRQAV